MFGVWFVADKTKLCITWHRYLFLFHWPHCVFVLFAWFFVCANNVTHSAEGSPMSSTYKPLFNNQRGGDGRGGPMALAPPRSTGRLSDRGKMNSYNRPYDYDGYFPDAHYDPRSYERREEKRSSTFKPLFASSRDQHPQNMRHDALAPMPRGRRSIRLSDEGKDQERFDRRMMRESDRRDYRGGPYSNELPYGTPSGGGVGSAGRLSDVGKEYDRRGGSMLARRSGPPPPPMYYDERPGMRRQSDLGKEKRYSGGVTYNADANEYSRSSTFKPLFDSQRNKTFMADSEFVMRGTPDRRRLSDGRDGGRYRISDDSNYYDPSQSAYFKYGGGLR